MMMIMRCAARNGQFSFLIDFEMGAHHLCIDESQFLVTLLIDSDAPKVQNNGTAVRHNRTIPTRQCNVNHFQLRFDETLSECA